MFGAEAKIFLVNAKNMVDGALSPCVAKPSAAVASNKRILLFHDEEHNLPLNLE